MNRRAFLGGLAALSGAAVAARFYAPARPGLAVPAKSLSQRFVEQYSFHSDENISRIDLMLGATIDPRHALYPRRASKSSRRYARRMKALHRRGMVA